MGKSCIRFLKTDDLALDVVGKAVERASVRDYIRVHDSVLHAAQARRRKL